MPPVETSIRTFLQRMVEIRSTGGATDETSYYSALENLMNELGKRLKPRVLCNGQLRNQGAGHPDFGLYSSKQCRRGAPKPEQGEIPERGVIEVKPLSDDSWQTAKCEQATKYFNRYRLVLVTNYREFRLIGEGADGKPVQREYFCLATNEAGFWSLAAKPVKSAREHGVQLGEFLQRVMLNAAPLTRPKDVAWFLASYGREALAKLQGKPSAVLSPIQDSLEIALGIKFTGSKGQHLFRSTLIQTLFYGVFSAWVVWAKRYSSGVFDWKSAGFIITVPMIRSLFEEFARPSRLTPLGLISILDRTGEALNRVDRVAFFQVFESGEAVQHFYEPFLKAFDPSLQREMGVWYTPREIVRYMVERTDAVLRSELGIADGLADKNVYVLDPCCGTGAYLIEVLRKIETTLREKGDDALIGHDVQEAARERVFGFEIMSAPFVIAHWQISDLLESLGAPMDHDKGERPAIYLTNALTGWEPPTGSKATLDAFPSLEAERDQAEHIKRDVPILVVLGNPPYNAFAGTSSDDEAGLVDSYKKGLQTTWGIKKFNLDDLYVRFFRIAERRIAKTGRGVVSYISNYSWTREPSFVVMREHILQSFDKIWIENMHGDRNKTEYAPDGTTSETIFSMRGFSPGIRQGIVVSLAVKTGKANAPRIVRYRDDIDAGRAEKRRQQLLDSLAVKPFDAQYNVADPQRWNRLSFRPCNVDGDYLSWPALNELGKLEPLNGLMEKRGGALFDVDRSALANRMQVYFDKSIDWSAFELMDHPLSKNAAGHKAEETRTRALQEAEFSDEQIVRYIVRPFDVRHAYFSDIPTIWNRARPKLWTQFSEGNRFLMSRPSGVANPEGPPVLFTCCLGDNDAQRGHSYYFPFQNHIPAEGMVGGTVEANLSDKARSWLKHLKFADPDADATVSATPWHHALAITYAPKYLNENADGIEVGWPRIPLPSTPALLKRSAELGLQVATLLDLEKGVPGVTSGKVAKHLRVLGNVFGTDLNVNAGWSNRDTKGRINPGLGKTEVRNWTDEETVSLCEGFAADGIDTSQAFASLGSAVDVYLNDDNCWRGVPEATWNYVIGGYLVIKKWLSYRENAILGRPITKDEAREFTAIVRRLTVLNLLTAELDANYLVCRDDAYNWPTT